MQSLILKLAKVFPQSLIAEILRIFGPKNTENFLVVFAGTTIKIPSTKDIREMEINLSIFETLNNTKTGAESRRLAEILAERYDLKHHEVRQAYRTVKKLLKEGRKMNEAETRITNYQKAKVKVKHRTKRRM